MRTIEGFVFGKTRQGFNRYLKNYRSYFDGTRNNYKYSYDLRNDSLDEIIGIQKYALLNKHFESLLTKTELAVVNNISYNTIDKKLPDNKEKYLSSAYEKWLMIFFHNENALFGEINPILLGRGMEYIRLKAHVSKTQLASMIGVDRTTVIALEKGKRLPSLEYFYKFSKIFNIPIDNILSIVVLR